MPSITSIDDLDLMLDGIKAFIKAGLPAEVRVDDYRLVEAGGDIEVPAAILDLEEFEPGVEAGFDPFSLRLHFCVYCILSRGTARVEREAMKFAATVARRVRKQNFGFDEMGEPERLSARPGNFKPGQQGYESWVVTWEQTLDLPPDPDGEADAEITPFAVFHAKVNLDPDIESEMSVQLSQS